MCVFQLGVRAAKQQGRGLEHSLGWRPASPPGQRASGTLSGYHK